ncbi:MAG: DUF1549 domain-containing protein [Opitutaceae bacterium]
MSWLLCILLSITTVSSLSARIFTNLDGRTIDAELHSIDRDQVRFKGNADARIYEVLIESLSLKDQAFIRNEQKAGRLTLTGYSGLNLPEVVPVEKNKLHFNASKQIDLLLQNYWESKGVEPAAIVDDETYLRRAYLKIIGRIPTHAEAVHFLDDRSSNKRGKLVDKLLDSNGYVSHNFNLWADILRVRTTGREGSRYGGVHYAQWLKEQIRQNVRYDDLVASLITAEGYPWDNPATAYYLRDSGMPLDNMSMTAQIFLGTQLQCAQCHNHPTDKWTQKEFYELSAFTYGILTRVDVNNRKSEAAPIMRKLRELAREETSGKKVDYRNNTIMRAAREFMQPLNWGVVHRDRALRLPDDYQYDDLAPGDKISPHVLYGELGSTELHDSSSRVAGYADWMVSKNNARFTKVIANRMWKRAMGIGLIEPIDNLTDESEATSPELMAFLESLMKGVDYDIKQYLRVLYNTDFFQRSAVIDNPDLDDDYHMEGPIFERMTSEQIWDSIATLMTPDVDTILQQSYTASIQGVNYETNKKPAAAILLEEGDAEAFVSYVEKLTESYKVYTEARSKATEIRSNPQLRKTPEGRKIQQAAKQATAEWRRLINPDLVDDGDEEPMGMSMMMSNTEMLQSPGNRKGKKEQEKWMGGIRRASELQSPQANGHLLEVFGQSDRLLIENSDDGSNVLQALFLMNSWQINGLLAHNSAPVAEARLASTVEEKIETLYLGFLSRKPTQQETELLVDYYQKDPKKARERIIWAMMNTQQFLFIQ